MITNKNRFFMVATLCLSFCLSASAGSWEIEAYSRINQAHGIVNSKLLSTSNKRKLLTEMVKETQSDLADNSGIFFFHPISSAQILNFGIRFNKQIALLNNKDQVSKDSLNATLDEIQKMIDGIY